MDLSIFEKAFALRDEARKAQLDAASLDLTDIHDLGKLGDKGELITPPHEDLAARFMSQAAALYREARVQGNEKSPTNAFLASVLAAATAPMGRVDVSALGIETLVAPATVANTAPKAATKAAPKSSRAAPKAATKPKPRLKRKPKK